VSDKLLIREVPEELHRWIELERKASLQTQNEFLLGVLRDACDRRNQLPLFQPQRHVESTPVSVPFTFIDLFAGIGGFRIALERLGGRCLFSSEWDRYAQRTYKEWFGHVPAGDIRKIDPAEIPDHQILAAGFPCQPFSIAGVSKKKSLGRSHGFKDVTQGTLFFQLATIIQAKRPPVVMLENVKNLTSHDGGRTWDVILKTLEDDLGYRVFHKVIDAAAFVPQHRERVFIVGFDKHVFGPEVRIDLSQVGKTTKQPKLRDILLDKVDDKYTLSDHLWTYLQSYAEKHREKGNGFGFGIADPDGVSRTLSARYFKDGSEILISQGKKKNPRRLTPRECARLMGFPDDLPQVVSDTQAYRQFGNAVVPPVAEAVGREVMRTLLSHLFVQFGSSPELLQRSA
jgi:DNA (cytosine-5)-methyltransferase 1